MPSAAHDCGDGFWTAGRGGTCFGAMVSADAIHTLEAFNFDRATIARPKGNVELQYRKFQT